MTVSHRTPNELNTLALTLADADLGQLFTIVGLNAPQTMKGWQTQLEDIGFLPGEHVAVMVRGMPGGDPLVVRVGLSTFALRQVEAACVQVVPV